MFFYYKPDLLVSINLTTDEIKWVHPPVSIMQIYPQTAFAYESAVYVLAYYPATAYLLKIQDNIITIVDKLPSSLLNSVVDISCILVGDYKYFFSSLDIIRFNIKGMKTIYNQSNNNYLSNMPLINNNSLYIGTNIIGQTQKIEFNTQKLVNFVVDNKIIETLEV
jgi:hypothetical protein